MPVHQRELVEAVMLLCDKKDMKACISQSLKGSLIAGGCAALGGIAFGRVGLLLGSAIGGLTALGCLEDFKSASEIIRNMTKTEKDLLYKKLVDAFRDVGYEDVILVSSLFVGPSLENVACRVVREFLNSKGYTIQN